jgi:hypothetical protein
MMSNESAQVVGAKAKVTIERGREMRAEAEVKEQAGADEHERHRNRERRGDAHADRHLPSHRKR